MTQFIKTPGGETLVLLALAEYEELRDAAEHAAELARVAAGEETLSADEMDALLAAPSPLRFWRRKRGITQAVLASKVGVSQPYIADIERGARDGNAALYKRLADVLQLDMEDLVVDTAEADVP